MHIACRNMHIAIESILPLTHTSYHDPIRCHMVPHLSSKNLTLKTNHLAPGDCVSADHYFSPVQGRLLHTFGKEMCQALCQVSAIGTPPQPIEEHEVTVVTIAIERRGGEIKINPHNLEANMSRAAVRQSPLCDI